MFPARYSSPCRHAFGFPPGCVGCVLVSAIFWHQPRQTDLAKKARQYISRNTFHESWPRSAEETERTGVSR